MCLSVPSCARVSPRAQRSDILFLSGNFTPRHNGLTRGGGSGSCRWVQIQGGEWETKAKGELGSCGGHHHFQSANRRVGGQSGFQGPQGAPSTQRRGAKTGGSVSALPAFPAPQLFLTHQGNAVRRRRILRRPIRRGEEALTAVVGSAERDRVRFQWGDGISPTEPALTESAPRVWVEKQE